MKRFRRKSSSSRQQQKQQPDISSTSTSSNVGDVLLSTRVTYLGCMQIPDARSVQLLHDVIKQVKQLAKRPPPKDAAAAVALVDRRKQVLFQIHATRLVVSDLAADPILNIPLACVSLCANAKGRTAADCFALSATARPKEHECFVFQAQSSKESSDIVRTISVSFKLLPSTRRASDPGGASVGSATPRSVHSVRTIPEDDDVKPNTSVTPLLSPRGGSRMHGRRSSLSSIVSNHRLSGDLSDAHSGSIGKFSSSLSGSLADVESLLSTEVEDLATRVDRLRADLERMKLVCTTGDASLLPEESRNFVAALFAIGRYDVDGLDKVLRTLSANAYDGLRRTLLHYATACGFDDAARVLLERNANLDAEDADGLTPLHLAAAAGDRTMVQLLLTSGAPVNALDNAYRSPLLLCVVAQTENFVECCYALIEKGAHVDTEDINGITPVSVFKELGEMQNRLVESACNALSSVADIQLSQFAASPTGSLGMDPADLTRSPIREGTFMEQYNSLHRSGYRLSTASSATWLSSTSSIASTLKHRSEVDLLGDGGGDGDQSAANLDGLDTDAKNALREFDDMLSKSSANLLADEPMPSHLDESEDDEEEDDIKTTPTATTKTQLTTAHSSSSPSSEATLTPSTSAWNTLDSTYRRPVATTATSPPPPPATTNPLIRDSADDFRRLSVSSLSTLASTTSTLRAPSSSAGTLDSSYRRSYVRRRSPGDETSAPSSSFSTLESSYRGGGGGGGGGGNKTASAPRRFSETSLQRRLAKFVKNGNGTATNGTSSSASASLPRRRRESESHESLLKLELGLSSLHLLVTLALNHECHGLILSHICLPTNSSELVRMTRSDALAGDNVRDCVATLLHRLFEASGPISRQRAVDAGLLSTVLELLDAPEPVQSTCLSVTETVLHSKTEGDRDFVAAVASMEPEVLLRLLREVKMTSALERYQSVALMVLSMASRYRSFCIKLNTETAFKCLTDIVRYCSVDEPVVWALKTLANMSAYASSRERLLGSRDVKRLLQRALDDPTSSSGKRYHAARALIYCGRQEVNGCYLFANEFRHEFLSDDDVNEEREEKAIEHVRACTIEYLVYLLTSEVNGQWRGLCLSPKRWSGPETFHSAENVVDFVLTALRTFIEPPVFLRLLIHRFRDLKTLQRLEAGKRWRRWQKTKDVVAPPSQPLVEEYAPLPVAHLHIMRILQHMLENFKHDFKEYPSMKKEIKKLAKPLKGIGGPYVPCSEKLKVLCHNVKKERRRSVVSEVWKTKSGDPAHEELYHECRQEITSGTLPVTVEQAVNLAAIQCYIEDLKSPPPPALPRRRSSTNLSLFGDKTLNTKLKHCLPPEIRGRTVAKKIRSIQEQLATESLSDRNAKHLYISKVYQLDQYGCRFFPAKDTGLSKGTLKRGGFPRRLVGISSRRIVILEEKTKELCYNFSFSQLKTWLSTDSNNTLMLEFPGLRFIFLVDSHELLRNFNGYIWECAEELDWMSVDSLDVTPWSRTAELQGKWGNVALVDVAKTPQVKQKASAILTSHVTDNDLVLDDDDDDDDDETNDKSSSIPSSTSSSATSSATSTPEMTLRANKDVRQRHEELSERPSMPPTFALDADDDEDATATELHSPLAPKESHASAASSYAPTQSDSGLGTNSSSAVSRTQSSRMYTASIVSAGSSGADAVSSARESAVGVGLGSGVGGAPVVCHCPPDPQLGASFDHDNVTLDSALDHPKELARQITLIDHDLLCKITAEDCLQKVKSSITHQSDVERQASVDDFAHRFNQMCNWVTASVLTARAPEQRAVIISQMIQVARYCYHYRNYNATMAILVVALGGTPVRRLKQTWEALDKESLDTYLKLEHIFQSKNNFKIYRERLGVTETPAIPYFGLFLKDLTFAADGNPDYLKGGLINLNKRRQMYSTLRELRRFQSTTYAYLLVPSIREYLLNHSTISDEDLHSASRQLEAPARRRKTRP